MANSILFSLLLILFMVACAPQINTDNTNTDTDPVATATPTVTATATPTGGDDNLYGPGVGTTGVPPHSFGPFITHGKASGSVLWSSKTHLPSDQSLFVSDGRLKFRIIARTSPGISTDIDGKACEWLALPYTKLSLEVGVRAAGTEADPYASAEALAAKLLAEQIATASESQAATLRSQANALLATADQYQALADQYFAYANTVGISSTSKARYQGYAEDYQEQADEARAAYNEKNAEATLAEAQATIDRAEANAAAAGVGGTSTQYLQVQRLGPVSIDQASEALSFSVPTNSTSAPFVVEVLNAQWDWNCIASGGSGYGCPMNQVYDAPDCIAWEIQMATSWTNDFED